MGFLGWGFADRASIAFKYVLTEIAPCAPVRLDNLSETPTLIGSSGEIIVLVPLTNQPQIAQTLEPGSIVELMAQDQKGSPIKVAATGTVVAVLCQTTDRDASRCSAALSVTESDEAVISANRESLRLNAKTTPEPRYCAGG